MARLTETQRTQRIALRNTQAIKALTEASAKTRASDTESFSMPTIDHGSLLGLSDDDHTQYHNTSRANTWLATKTTDNLTQGATNLYLTAAEQSKLSGIEVGATADQEAHEVPYDNAGSTLAATDVEAAIDELDSKVEAVSGGATNLAYDAATRVVSSDTGTDATLTLADGTNPGLMASADFTKLAGIATGATANASDADLRDRATHTGTQATSTITGLDATLSAASSLIFTNITNIAANTAAIATKSDIGHGHALSEITGRSGTSFPGSPADGDLFYRTDLSCTFYWDAGRSKWLSSDKMTLTWGTNTSVTGNYLRCAATGLVTSATRGWVLPYDAVLVSASALSQSSVTGQFRIQYSGTLAGALVLTAATSAYDNALNSDLMPAGSAMACLSTAASGVCVVMAEIRRTAT